MSCQCKNHCDSRRCPCLKSGEQCQAECKCRACKNPLNTIDDIKGLTACALANIVNYQRLIKNKSDLEIELPCGCEEVPIQSLIYNYTCSECDEPYYYSFCWNDVVGEDHTWHCEKCNQCREYREWHCDYCNRCTYGLSLPCEGCGRKSDIARIIG